MLKYGIYGTFSVKYGTKYGKYGKYGIYGKYGTSGQPESDTYKIFDFFFILILM